MFYELFKWFKWNKSMMKMHGDVVKTWVMGFVLKWSVWGVLVSHMRLVGVPKLLEIVPQIVEFTFSL